MRVSRFSFLLYSLSLAAVAAGQSTAVTNAVTQSTVSQPTSSESSTTTSKPSTTSVPTTSEEPTTSEVPTTTQDPTTTKESTTSTPTQRPTTSDETTTDAPTETSSSKTTKVPVKTITTIHTISGTPVQTTMTSSQTEASSTEPPSLNGEGDNSNDSGLSSSEKKIVIGVVVGVGGAIIIGAIAVVAWRIHVRKRNALDQDDSADLMSGTAVGAGAREKAPSPGSQGTPFRSTLDQYHNPGPVNAASNF